MNREIKFEYGFESVNGIVKKVYHLHQIHEIAKICDVWNVLPIKYTRQYTGLKDKNGKEIYEGDILEYADQPSMPERFYEVIYSTSDEHISSEEPYIAAYMLKEKRGFRQLICNVTRPYRYAEVAGNIHENPELL